MDLPTDVEEILSDDYEEGEILDGDNLYDEVSSLEEFSSDDEPSQLKNSNQETEKHDSVLDKLNQNTKHRRKDHKCKENSVCRKERKAKHCYARIRKAKSSTKHKTVAEIITQSTVEKVFPRKPDPMPVKHLKSRPVSPFKARPDPPKIPHRLDYKDYHEKENRHNNKRFWANPPRNNKMKAGDKHVHYNRNKVNKDNHYSKLRYRAPTPPPPPPPPKPASVEGTKTDTTKSDNSFNKTSLLKRLVGSGTTGVKPIKDNESSLVSPKPDSVNSSDIPPSISEENLNGSSENNNEIENISTLKDKPEENEKIEILSEPHKKIEVKWIRSMKEDKDELHLRVEALKSAWVKKFNDRKKKGLIHQKKSDDSDDFLKDFALGSDSEEEKDDVIAPTKTNDSASGNTLNVPRFNATDISGDILKPEDMVIVNDKPAEETIISETPVATTEVNSSVFVDPLFFSVGQYSQNTNICQVSNSNSSLSASNLITTAVVSSDTLTKNNWKSSVSYSSKHKQTPSGQNLSENDQFSLSSNKSKSKKSRWKKRRRSKGNIVDTPKSVDASNMSADLDEDELRELALLSVRRKNKTKSSEASNDAGNNKNNPQSSIESGVLQVSNTPADKVTTSLGESESTGAGSGDNWEDDLDVDILRAKLLSSLTKQISEENVKLERVPGVQEPEVVKERVVNNRIFKPVVNIMKLNSPKKQVMKKIDKRKLRNILTKKVWKQGLTTVRKARQDVRISINHFVKPEVLKKSDSSMANNAPSMRPIPQVAQMIIKLDDSDSSSDLETSNSEPVEPFPKLDFVPPEIEANIDLLLREAKLNSQLEKVAKDRSSVAKQLDSEETRKFPENLTPSDECVLATMAVQPVSPWGIKRPKVKTPTSSSSSCSSVKTPQVLKHLSAWQQEEYKRLKKKIAEKEKVLQVTRSKIIEPSKDTNVLPTVSSEGKNPTVSDSVPITSSSNTISQSISSTSLSIAGNSPSPTTTNDETVINNIGVVGKPVKVESSSSASDSLESNKILLSKALPKVDKPCSLEDTSVAKKGFPNLVSCTIIEEINLMNDIVNDFDKNNSEYTDLKQKTARLKRILKATELKMAVKKKTMFQIRDTLTEKERQISSKIAIMANTTQADTNKLPSRDMEMVKLKYKEVSLRAQFVFHNFLSEKILANNNNGDKKSAGSIVKPESKNKEISSTGIKRTLISKESTPLKKKLTVKDPTVVAKNALPQDKAKDHAEAPVKRTFSGKEREREEWDPNTPVCHYDLHGICRDEECQYQHFKTV